MTSLVNEKVCGIEFVMETNGRIMKAAYIVMYFPFLLLFILKLDITKLMCCDEATKYFAFSNIFLV